mmetsp:Transcript_31581/g.76262  ORF Transcript_31581/g.76262 Transcript_31581/m.76262 type:complete len:367 (+) Transcript_31581:3330-4430(+)
MDSVKGVRAVACLLSLDTSVAELEGGSNTFTPVETIDISALFKMIRGTVGACVKIRFVTVLALESLVSWRAIASFCGIRTTGSAICTKQIIIVIGTKLFRRILTVFSSKQFVLVGSSGTVAVVFLCGDAIGIGKLSFHTSSTVEACISTAIFRRCLAEWPTKVVGTQTLHVAVNILLGPDMTHSLGLGRIPNTDYALSIILAVKGAVRNSSSLEFAVTSFPAIVTNARIWVIGWKIWIAITSIDTEIFSFRITELFRGRLAVFTNITSSITSHRIDTITKELFISKLVLHSRDAFSPMITLVSTAIITGFILVITEDSSPPIRTSTVHAILMHWGIFSKGNLVSRQVRRTHLTRRVCGTFQSTLLR